MRRVTILMVLAVAFAVSTSEAAKPTSKPPTGGKPTITKIQTQKGATKAGTVKVSTSKGSTVKATSVAGSKSVKPAKTTAQAARGGGQTKVSDSKSLKSAKANTGVAKADKSVKADAKTTKAEARTAKAGSSTTSTSSFPNTSTSTIDFTATKAGALLEKNSALRSKIEAKLLAAGYTGSVYEAAYGFKNAGQLNAATNMVQNHGTSFELLKVLMTGTYVDPATHLVYRTQKLPDGTTQLVRSELATTTAPTLSLGQAKQSIAGGAVMPGIVVGATTGTSTTTTGGAVTTTAGKSKAKKHATTTQPGGGL